MRNLMLDQLHGARRACLDRIAQNCKELARLTLQIRRYEENECCIDGFKQTRSGWGWKLEYCPIHN